MVEKARQQAQDMSLAVIAEALQRRQQPRSGQRVSASPASSPSALGDDLGGLGLSIDISGTGYQDPEDLPVYMGGEVTKAGQIRVRHTIRKQSDVYLDLYRWDAGEGGRLREFQERAFNAGLYGTADRDDVRWGDYDEDTARAWRIAVDRSAAFYAAGKKITPDDALKAAGIVGGGPRGETREPFAAQVANPITLRRGLRAAAKAVLGTDDVDDGRIEQMVAAFQAQQIGAQRAAYNAQEGGGVVTAAPDFEAFAEQETRRIDPLKADARGALKGFDVVRRMFTGEA